jgi:hypothetical protein
MEPVCTIAPPRPAARGLHGPRSSLSGEEGAVEDVVEKTIEFDLGHLEEGLRREDAGIVEQHIEAAEAVERRLHESFAGGRQRDVAHIDGDARPRRVDIMGSRLGLRAIAAVDNDGTALGDEAGRKLLTHARTTAGNDRNLVLEPHSFSPFAYLPIDRSMRHK